MQSRMYRKSYLFRKTKRDRMTDAEALVYTHTCTESKLTSHFTAFLLYIRYSRAKSEFSYSQSKIFAPVVIEQRKTRFNVGKKFCGDISRRERTKGREREEEREKDREMERERWGEERRRKKEGKREGKKGSRGREKEGEEE